jgi:glycosyltransferase involved in cell wall biosynthesis
VKKVALVHDWLTGMRGGEKVLAEIAAFFPNADLFTLLHSKGACESITRGRRVITSRLNRLPGIHKYYRYCLPIMPRMMESLDARGYDLIVSTSHCVAKGIRKDPHTPHICYCHSPMRYIWGMQDSYGSSMKQSLMGKLAKWGLRRFTKRLQKWDVESANNVTTFLANSQTVANRIQTIYQRDSAVLYPPADTEYYCPDSSVARVDQYLVVGAMAPYKRVDQAVEAFAFLPEKKLVVIGTGQMEKTLRAKATPNVTFLGWASDDEVRKQYRQSKALLFPGEEDFGIIPVEAMACGTPVIACDAGGATETVPNEPGMGLRYEPQTVEGLVEAIRTFEKGQETHREALVAHAQTFSRKTFSDHFRKLLEHHLTPAELDV